jgi:dephospho-CoA kinase
MPTPSKKIIFGFTGLMASGKGAAALYLGARHAARTFRFSTILRDLLKRLDISETRENLVGVSEAIRHQFGEDILAKAMAHDAATASEACIVIEGIRREADITYLQKLPNFVLVSIDADLRTRYDRLVKRGENADDRSKTWEQFVADQERSTEISVPPVMALAQEHIDNNGTPQDLEHQLDELVKKYL